MKNWNYIEGAKVENSLGKDIYQHKLDPNQYMVVDWDKQTVTIISNGHVRDVIKNVDNLAYALHLYKKVNVMNTKTGNADIVKDGDKWIVIYAEGTKSKEFDSKDKADKFAKEVGNESLGEYMAKKPRVINEEKTGAEEFFKKLADDVKEREDKDDADIEKVGNAKDKNDRDMKIGDMVDVHGKKGKIQKIITAKDSRDDVIEVFFDNSGTYNPDRTDRFYANEVVKVGNSASGDKFAYVMREFDEGKLKTPDGKVVTDPAQAKAIAYSESKKIENGLARARNAIK